MEKEMIYEIIKEINHCLDNDCCMAALSLALMLPDICGKALYPQAKNKERYVKWFDEYIGKYNHDDEHIELGVPYLNGKLVYSLRCSVLHQGNPSVKKKECNVDYFELLYSKYDKTTMIQGVSEYVTIKDENGICKAINNRISINVRSMCWQICKLAELCYKENKEKFDFFNYHIESMDFHTREIFFKE